MALLYPAKGIKTDTSLTKYYHAAIIDTFILKRSARGPRANVAGAMPRDEAFPWGVSQPVASTPNNPS